MFVVVVLLGQWGGGGQAESGVFVVPLLCSLTVPTVLSWLVGG